MISTRCSQGAATLWLLTQNPHPSPALEDTAHSATQARSAACCKTCVVFQFQPFISLVYLHSLCIIIEHINAFNQTYTHKPCFKYTYQSDLNASKLPLRLRPRVIMRHITTGHSRSIWSHSRFSGREGLSR